jgi:uncharacterized LabA/DUF88 family protein
MPDRTYAFIDSQNLILGIKYQGWKLDYRRFRVYLLDKYNVDKAFMFIGQLPGNELLYKFFEECGFELVFKPILAIKNTKTKSSTDIELVLKAAIEIRNFNKAVVVTGDGDLYCLIDYLKSLNKLHRVLIPNSKMYSKLLSFHAANRLDFMNNLRPKLEYME